MTASIARYCLKKRAPRSTYTQDAMGRAAISLPDEKMPIDVENEKLLDVEDDSALLECEEDGKRHRSHSWSEYVPSIREVVRLVLFCAVTVVGMTFISEFVPTPQWSTVRPHLLSAFPENH